MDKFSKLRFHEFAKVAAAATVSGVLALQPGPAQATPINIGSGTGKVTIAAGKAKWFVNNDITFSTTSSAWGFSEASLQTTAGTRHDAVDGALSWHVNPVPAPGNQAANEYRSPNGTIDISPNYPTDPTVATTLTAAPQTLQGLTVTGQMYFFTNKAIMRSILSLQNPTGAPITVSVLSASNLGSDQNTVLQTTSSGDNVFDANDNWFVSSETATPTTTNDPILTFAFQGPGSAVRGTNVNAPGGSRKDLFYENYTVTVPAGETRMLMTFVQMSGTVSGAETDAANFNSAQTLDSAGYLAGLSGAQRALIANWNIPLLQPTLAWTAPAAITYGMALGATQLDATATYNGNPVTGTFSYTPAAGTVLNAGANQTLSATFVPTDTADYATPGSPVTTTITVVQASTTTTAVLPASSSVGSPADISANVAVVAPGAGTPTGTMTIADTTDGLSCSYSLGAATPGCTITPPSAGTKSLTLTYSGDSNFSGSTGTGSLTVGAAASGTALASSLNPSIFGQSVVFTATVTPTAGAPTPTGMVNFNDGATLLCANVTLNSGTASCTASSLSAGSHSIQASYGGDTNTVASSSSLTQAVNAAGTAMSLIATPSTLLSGQSLLLTATVSVSAPAPTNAGAVKSGSAAPRPVSIASTVGASTGAVSPAATVPTGTVTFLDGATTLGSSALNASGVATFNVSTLSVGTHTLTSNFTGNGSFASATAVATVTVNPAVPPVQAPTLSTWMLTLLGFGLSCIGVRRARVR